MKIRAAETPNDKNREIKGLIALLAFLNARRDPKKVRDGGAAAHEITKCLGRANQHEFTFMPDAHVDAASYPELSQPELKHLDYYQKRKREWYDDTIRNFKRTENEIKHLCDVAMEKDYVRSVSTRRAAITGVPINPVFYITTKGRKYLAETIKTELKHYADVPDNENLIKSYKHEDYHLLEGSLLPLRYVSYARMLLSSLETTPNPAAPALKKLTTPAEKRSLEELKKRYPMAAKYAEAMFPDGDKPKPIRGGR